MPFYCISIHSLSIQNELYTIRRRGIGVGITLLLVIWLLYCLREESLIAESVCNIPPSQIILLPNNARMTPYTWYYTWAYLFVTITNRRCDPNQFFVFGKVPQFGFRSSGSNAKTAVIQIGKFWLGSPCSITNAPWSSVLFSLILLIKARKPHWSCLLYFITKSSYLSSLFLDFYLLHGKQNNHQKYVKITFLQAKLEIYQKKQLFSSFLITLHMYLL